jgi:hypothetical protein
MHTPLPTRILATLLALVAGVPLAVGASAFAASGSTSGTAPAANSTTPSVATQTNTVTKTVTQPTQTVTQPATTVTQTTTVKAPAPTVTQSTTVTPTVQSTTVTPTVTTSTQTAPNGAAVAVGAALGAAGKAHGNDQAEGGGLPTWAWVLIGLGVIGAVVAAFVVGKRRGEKPGDPPTGQSPPAEAQTEILPQTPPGA